MTRARSVPSNDLEPGIEGLAGSSPVPAFRFRTADFELRITVRKQRQPHRTEDELCKGATGHMTKYGWLVKSFPNPGYKSAFPVMLFTSK